MIDPEQFYGTNDEPSPATRKAMWRAIRPSIAPEPMWGWLAVDRRSFLLGMAASIVVALTVVGAGSLVSSAIDRAQPSAVRIDQAYESAIKDFQGITAGSVVSATGADGVGAPTADLLRARTQELDDLDRGINSLRAEIKGGDVSPMKRSRLQQLYARKLRVLELMIEQGEIEL